MAQHNAEMEGKKYAVYNPHKKPFSELPIIFGFNNGGPRNFKQAALVAEDGTGLGGHLCSSEGYMRHDLGILKGSRPDRHEGFVKHYPDGYRMDFVGEEDVMEKTNIALEAAIKRNQESPPQEEDKTESKEMT